MKICRGPASMWGVLVGMIVLFAGAVLVPFGIRDARLQTRIDTARADLGIGEFDNAGLAKLFTEVQDLREQIAGRGQSIPNEDEISLVLQDLSGLINGPGVTGQEIITDKAKYFADYNILPVKIQFNAPFATAYDMVKRIESLSRVVRVDRLDIESEPDYPRQPLVINLQLSAFFASQAGAGAGDRGGER